MCEPGYASDLTENRTRTNPVKIGRLLEKRHACNVWKVARCARSTPGLCTVTKDCVRSATWLVKLASHLDPGCLSTGPNNHRETPYRKYRRSGTSSKTKLKSHPRILLLIRSSLRSLPQHPSYQQTRWIPSKATPRSLCLQRLSTVRQNL
jgi:hypothetical protein